MRIGTSLVSLNLVCGAKKCKRARSQPMRSVAECKSLPRNVVTANKRQHLERFAHFGGRRQRLHRGRLAEISERFRRADFSQSIEQPAGKQERRLRCESRYAESCALARFGDRREIDVRRQIGKARP